MSKKIENYLHLYLGCEMKSEDSIFTLLPSHFQSNWNKLDFMKAKPILRPLSDITDEERKQLWQLIFNKPFPLSGKVIFFETETTSSDPRHVLMSGVQRLGIERNGTVWADSDLHIKKHNQHEVTLLLLQQGFDLFNLIPDGLAIDKTTSNHE